MSRTKLVVTIPEESLGQVWDMKPTCLYCNPMPWRPETTKDRIASMRKRGAIPSTFQFRKEVQRADQFVVDVEGDY